MMEFPVQINIFLNLTFPDFTKKIFWTKNSFNLAMRWQYHFQLDEKITISYFRMSLDYRSVFT